MRFPCAGLLALLLSCPFVPADDRPNILWITIEDWGPDLSCYGTPAISTPHVDRLAAEGIRFETAFTTSPVCSTSRSAMMTGFHQNYLGAHQHRTHEKQPLPHGIKPIPHLFAEAGYHTALMSRKTDCNFTPHTPEELFMGKDWNERAPGQPFFARITLNGTHRIWNRDPVRPIDPADVELPPYYPDTAFVRRDWANGLEQMQLVDRQVGELLQRLEDEGLADNTIVVFLSDHGRCHVRGKQFLYDGGIRIPLIMRWPGQIPPGGVSDDLVMSLDVCATLLEAAGITAPVPLHGANLFGPQVSAREYVFSARGKMDETHDAMRAVRSRNFKLIHNLMPERAWAQYNAYKEGAYPVLAELNVLHREGRLTPEQSIFMAPAKPEFELFDLSADPHEVRNLADDPAHAQTRAQLLAALQDWRENVIEDQGVSAAFRADQVFGDQRPTDTVNEWVEQNAPAIDFRHTGWPGWYPTRTLEQWRVARRQWEPWVFRPADSAMTRPHINSFSRTRERRAQGIDRRPNIVWIMLEDWSTDLGCYGNAVVQTPHVDRLAAEGELFRHAFGTAPVCSSARSAMLTGFHQNYIGGHQHDTKGEDRRPLPHGIQTLPYQLREAGYFTALQISSKTHHNFDADLGFAGDDWSQREPGQPFFAQITLTGTHRPWNRDPLHPIDPADVHLPPYYADTPLARRDWANGLEQMQLCDRQVGDIMQRLADEGIADNTVVFLIGDNGRCHIRGKQFLYEPGLQVPLIVHGPGRVEPGRINEDLVSMIDVTATIFDLAEVKPAIPLHGHNLWSEEVQDRAYIFAARGRMGLTHDAMRSIRSERYKLIHNLMPERAWLQYSGYKEDNYPMLAEMNVLNLRGELNETQARFFAPHKPEFELFDLASDPHEIHNLADDPRHAKIKDRLLTQLYAWRASIEDQGVADGFRFGGRPSTYPTRSLAEWEQALAAWQDYVLRGPEEIVPHPNRQKY